jgi:hypothetical protein
MAGIENGDDRMMLRREVHTPKRSSKRAISISGFSESRRSVGLRVILQNLANTSLRSRKDRQS